MPNQRVYDQVDGAVFNGVAIGGATQIVTTSETIVNVDAEHDGSQGVSESTSEIWRVRSTINTTDVTKMIAALISAPSAGDFFGHESATATFEKASLKNPVFFSAAFDANVNSHATLSLQAQCRFGDGDDLEDVESYVAGQPKPAKTHPGRLWRPLTALHGSTPGIAPLHVQQLSFSVSARGGSPLEDSGDGDKGTTAVDVPPFDKVPVTLVIRDTKVKAGAEDVAGQLLKAGVADLVVTLEGVGATANQTLTLRNCKFNKKTRTSGAGWTGVSLTGHLVFRDPVTPFTERTIDDAIVANRLINFA